MNEDTASARPRSPSRLGGRLRLDVRDPVPFENSEAFWLATAQAATLVICTLMLGALLYAARPLLLPVLCAFIVGLTFGPYIGRAVARGVPAWLLAAATVAAFVGIAYVTVVLLANPLSEALRRAPEMAETLREKLLVFDRPLAALQELRDSIGGGPSDKESGPSIAQMLTGAVTVVTPAALESVLQIILFVGTLFFFITGRTSFRKFTVGLFTARAARLRALKIMNDVEENLSSYLVVVTAINLCLGVLTAIAAYLLGLPSPILWGAMAFAFNYIPYIGSGIVCVLLFAAGLLTYPTIAGALLPPAVFLALTTVEGQFITPAVVGRRVLSVHPLAVFLAIAFWAWLWGPIGAFLATPILIVARATIDHLYPRPKGELPD